MIYDIPSSQDWANLNALERAGRPAFKQTLADLAETYCEVRAEAGRYGDQCAFTQKTLGEIRVMARELLRQAAAEVKRLGLEPRASAEEAQC